MNTYDVCVGKLPGVLTFDSGLRQLLITTLVTTTSSRSRIWPSYTDQTCNKTNVWAIPFSFERQYESVSAMIHAAANERHALNSSLPLRNRFLPALSYTQPTYPSPQASLIRISGILNLILPILVDLFDYIVPSDIPNTVNRLSAALLYVLVPNHNCTVPVLRLQTKCGELEESSRRPCELVRFRRQVRFHRHHLHVGNLCPARCRTQWVRFNAALSRFHT